MKIRCEVCGIEGHVQHLSENYYRVKHYLGTDPATGRLRFKYHKQSLVYVQSILEASKIDPIDPTGHCNVDLKTLKCVSDDEKVRAGSSVWYERLTCTQEVGGSNPPQSTQNPE